MKKIVLDTYGADAGAEVIVRGAYEASQVFTDAAFVLSGDEVQIKSCLDRLNADMKRFEILPARDYISNTDSPMKVYGDDNYTSLALCYDYLKTDSSSVGLLSAGSTGAVLVGSICRLGLFGNLQKPALSSSIPTIDNKRYCLTDCGANIDCTAEEIVQFALMGNAFAQSCYDISRPEVALLSVGREAKKGNAVTLEAFEMLKSRKDINFIGNCEGSDLISGYADVYATDGFSGNLMLKAIESAGKAAMQLTESLRGSICCDDDGFSAIHNTLNTVFELNSRGGATFLGTKKTVIKMHGCAVEQTVTACIDQMLHLNSKGFAERVQAAVEAEL